MAVELDVAVAVGQPMAANGVDADEVLVFVVRVVESLVVAELESSPEGILLVECY